MTNKFIKSVSTFCLLASSITISAEATALDWPTPANFRMIDQNGVDMVSGNVVRSFSDLAGSGGLGHTIIFDNILDPLDNFMDNYTGGFGKDRGGSNPVSDVHMYIGDFYAEFNESGGTYTPLNGTGTTLTKSGSIFTYTTKDGTIIKFDDSKVGKHSVTQTEGIITQITYPDGRVMDFNYVTHSGKERLQSVTSSDGHQLQYTYPTSGSNVQPTSIISFSQAHDYCSITSNTCSLSNVTKVTYTVAGSGNSRTITAAGASVGSLLFDFNNTTGYLSDVKPFGATAAVTYAYASAQGATRVSSVTTAGSATTYSYTGGSLSLEIPATITAVRPQNGTDTVKVDVLDAYIVSATKSDQDLVYNGSSNNRLISSEQATTSEKSAYEYDSRNNVKKTTLSGTGLSLVTEATYPASCSSAKYCNKPETTTDAGGNVTNYTYHSSSGMIEKVTAPAASSGGTRPETRYTYAQKYAWKKNSGSGYSQISTPIWVLTKTSSCTTGAASGAGCATAADEVTVEYDYEAGSASVGSNLRVKGVVVTADSLSRRTCFTYDKVGNKISETSPLGTSSTCN